MELFKTAVAAAAILGLLDMLIGNRFHLGEEFERGFKLWGSLALSMIGMILLAPWIAQIAAPLFGWIAAHTPFDPSVLPASLLAGDMGGTVLCMQVARDEALGRFNGVVVASMMGCTVSFTLPFSLGAVKKEQQTELCQGILCGVVTVPVGCFSAGLMMGLPLGTLVTDLIPLLLLAALIAIGLVKAPRLCTALFKVISTVIRAMILTGLAIGILQFIPGIRILENPQGYEEAAMICVNAATVLAGMFPMFALISRLLKKPLDRLAGTMKINSAASVGLLSNLLTNIAPLDTMDRMDSRGAVINSAFAVSAAFVFGDHLSYTMAVCEDMVPYLIVGKLVSGVCGVLAALLLLSFNAGKKEKH